jgi:hypothetical protein
MYLKPVRIYYKVSETLMKIYEFCWSSSYADNKLTYSFYYESRRNDESDTWGHLWFEVFRSQILKEERVFCDLHDYHEDSWDYNELDVQFQAIAKKYDPYKQFTNSGEYYLIAQRTHPPTIDPNINIEEAIKNELYKWVESVNIVIK